LPEDIFFGEFLDNGLHLTGIEAGKKEIVTGHGGQILEQVPTPRQIKFGVRVLYNYAENPSQAGKNFSTDRKRFVILRVFVSSWWIGSGFSTKAPRREESPSFWLLSEKSVIGFDGAGV